MTEIKVGSYIKPDGWAYGELLKPGLDLFCPFYLPTNSGGPIKELAVKVEITGRIPRRIMGGYYLRVRITFIGDCEPDTVVGGWTTYKWD